MSILTSCVTSGTYHKGSKVENIWFKGSIKEAFQESRKQNKPSLVYWGAVWCPPCNEMKDQVFSKAKFAKIMEQYIPIYLDGDTEEAQIWADKLQAYGYPTILIFSPEGKELLRISSGVNLEEFELALSGVRNRSLEELLVAAKAEALDENSWKRLAYTSWSQLPKDKYPPEKTWKIQKDLIHKVPKALVAEASALASAFLISSAALTETSHKKFVDQAKGEALEVLSLVFKNSESIRASRGFITSEAVTTLKWLVSHDPKLYDLWKQRWLDAAATIRKSDYASVDTRLWASYPQLDLFRWEHPKKDPPPQLKNTIITAALEADQQALSKYERQSVISGAAYLLQLVKAYNDAERMLKKEITKSDSPWYYQSSLARMYANQDKNQEALFWSGEARRSAKGRATKLQWITSDLVMTAKVRSDDQELRLLGLAEEYYGLATQLKDGFSGRNFFRGQRVAEALQDYKKKPKFVVLLKKYKKNCSSLNSDSKQACDNHFKELL